MGALGLGFRFGRGRTWSPRALFTGGAAGAWYDPSDLLSLAQNADGSGAAAVDAPVGRMADKSGRGNHALQAIAAARPMLRRDGAGRLYLEFDGVDDGLRASFAIPQPIDRVSAFRQTEWTLYDRIFGGANAAVTELWQTGSAPALQMRSSASVTGPSTSDVPVGQTRVVTERFSGSTSRMAVGGGAYVQASSGTNDGDGISIANDHNQYRAGAVRFYGAAMIARALSDADIGRLRRFMASRAGIAL